MLAVGFAYLTFHAVAFHGPFKPFFGHTDQDGGYGQILSFNWHVDDTQRKSRKRLAASCEEFLYQYPAIQPFYLWQSGFLRISHRHGTKK